jgi:hypothetical protein
MATTTIFLKNEDNADLYVDLYDELAKKSIWSEKYLRDGGTESADIELGESGGEISWSCYRKDEEDKVGADDNVEVTSGETVEISTD